MIPALESDYIYGIQFKYVKHGKPTVYAARDVYALPSASDPTDRGRIATIPVTDLLRDKTYAYRICESTFTIGAASHWRALINHAFKQWENAANYWGQLPTTLEMVRDVYTESDVAGIPHLEDTVGQGKPCANYSQFIDTFIRRFDLVMAGILVAPGGTVLGDPRSLATNLILSLRVTSLFGVTLLDVQEFDSVVSEVIADNDASMAHDLLEDVGVFPQFAKELGYSWCWRGDAQACVSVVVGGDVVKPDIFLKASAINSGNIAIPGGDGKITKADTYLLDCSDLSLSAYRRLVHEAGHAVGLISVARGVGHDQSHASINYSVMASPGRLPDYCAPTPFDQLAIYLLFRS